MRIWGFLLQRAVCKVHCIECTLMLQKIITKEVGARCPGVILLLNLALLLLNFSRYFYTFYKLLYVLVKHWSLAHWNLPWQSRIALTYKLFVTNRKKIYLNVSSWEFSHCYPVNQYQLIRALSAQGGALGMDSSLRDWPLQSPGISQGLHCLQNRGITFVPKTF